MNSNFKTGFAEMRRKLQDYKESYIEHLQESSESLSKDLAKETEYFLPDTGFDAREQSLRDSVKSLEDFQKSN